MAWSDVSTNAIDIKKHIGKAWTGTYKGHKQIETKIGPQVIWQFSDADGVGFGIYGFTNLNRAMEVLDPGAVVKITYQGTEKVQTKFGLKDVHQCAVQVWTPEEGGDPKADPPKTDLSNLPF